MGPLLMLGITAGIALYLAKLGSFYLLLKPFPGIRHWVHNTPVALFVLDGLGGYIAGHFFIGSNIGMVAMITFGSVSMGLIFISIWWKESKLASYLKGNKPRKVAHQW